MNSLKTQLVPTVGVLLIAVGVITWSAIRKTLDVGEIAIAVLILVLVFALMQSIYTLLNLKPHALFEEARTEYEKMNRKIQGTVDKLIQRQRFIDQNILSIIEGEAQNIWVITTKLENELRDPELQRAVKQNLEAGKHYTYFLPHPEAAHFSSIKRNIESFKELQLYKEHRGQVEFIRLPLETQFLLEEVVIYNPEKPEKAGEEGAKGINGFTYYEAKDEESDTLHMKIEGDLLRFLADRLYDYLKSSGLKIALDSILTEFISVLPDEVKIKLIDRLREREIPEEDLYAITKDLEEAGLSSEQIKTIRDILAPYTKKE